MQGRCAVLICAALALLSAVPEAVFAKRKSVTVPTANVRSGPGTKYPNLWQVELYHPVDLMEQSGDWCRFKDFEGEDAWILCSLLTDKVKCGIAKIDQCNVRKEPNTKADVVFTVEKGVPFKILKTDGQWHYAEFPDGDKGWVHKSLMW
jgi:SH3-like domain-containing protein